MCFLWNFPVVYKYIINTLCPSIMCYDNRLDFYIPPLVHKWRLVYKQIMNTCTVEHFFFNHLFCVYILPLRAKS